MAARKRQRSRRTIEAVLVLAIIIVIVLIAVRVVRFASGSGGVSAMDVDVSEPNLRGVRVRVPGRPHFIPDYLGDPDSVGRWVTYTLNTNSEGLRSPEFEVHKPAGRYRAICAGECVAFGNGVDETETYPYVLDTLLDSTFPGRDIEVINGSRPGLRAAQIVDLAEQQYMGFAPDLVVFGPGANTVFLPDHVGGAVIRIELTEEEYAREMDLLRESVTRMLDLSRIHGFDLVFVTPTINTFFYPDGIRWSEELVALGEEYGIPTVDTTEMFLRIEGERGLVLETEQGRQRLVGGESDERRVLYEVDFDDEGNTRYVAPEIYAYLDDHPKVSPVLSIDENHPNAEGQALIARALHDVVVDAGWIGSAGR
jgi:lysophospholipase L1-like esterase